MKTISFTKMVASGNDFVVVDNRRKIIHDVLRFARAICLRHEGVGADGVLLIENSAKAAFKMRIINSDGSEAEACGNGFRCAALYAHRRLGLPARLRFESLSGVIDAEVTKTEIKVLLSPPKDLKPQAKLKIKQQIIPYSFINTGVPHAVVFVKNLKATKVGELGRAIRYHAVFHPKGTNVNFVQSVSRHEIAVRTYERGVEGETQACGTGASASAILSVLHGKAEAPVCVKTSGGEILKIGLKHCQDRVENVTLSGAAQFVYEGQWSPVSAVLSTRTNKEKVKNKECYAA